MEHSGALLAGRDHPVERVVATIGGALDDAAELSLIGLDRADAASAVIEVARLEARVAELRLRLLAHADEVGVGTLTASSTKAWLAAATSSERAGAVRSVHLAGALAEHAVLRTALATGAISVDQAQVVARALDDLPTSVCEAEGWVPLAAERVLVAQAVEGCSPRELRLLGRHVFSTVAPEAAEAHDARVLAREEREANDLVRCSMAHDGHGRVHGRFVLPELHAAMLRKQLTAHAAYGHPLPADGPEGVPVATGDASSARRRRTAGPRELGRALCALIERLDVRDAPQVGGTGATVVVTMTLEQLLGDERPTDGEAMLDTGDRVTASTARRLACGAGIIPVMLGGAGQVLDLGRTRRFFSRAQLVALGVRDRHCTAVGCETAAWLCHAHHDDPWSRGGRTDLARGRLLCPSHHRRIHDPAYEHRVRADGRVEFVRRT